MNRESVHAVRIRDESQRERALEVLRATYRDEKRWVDDETSQLPREDLLRDDVAWFAAFDGDRPLGVLRVLYDPPLEQYRKYELELLDQRIDIDAFLRQHRIAEIGRFAVIADRRRNMSIALALLREAIADTVRRGFSHYVTDVFEGEVNSPYQFHTRVLGFVPVATHATGELHCDHRRVTLVLDLRQCYERLSAANGYFFRLVTQGWDESLHAAIAGRGGQDRPYPPEFAGDPAERRAV
jgi:Acetyltransferase (GNAT) family